MFEWFSKMFSGGGSPQVGSIDPEAGIPISEFQPQGQTDYSSGEGMPNWANMSKKQYADLGRSFQAQQVGSNITQGGINAGFDNAWLGEYEHAGSAEGQKIS